MHRLLQELHQDHINLSRVLRLLETQLDLIQAGDHVDVHVLGEIIDYVQSYPDLIHHPREDVIFAVYRERASTHLDVIDRLLDEHRTLIASTTHLKISLDQWRSDSPVPREHIVALISDYLRMQWDHLNLEEGSIYGPLEQGLDAGDWVRIEAALPHGTDPLFGDLVRQRYQNLYERVLEYAY